MIYFGLLPDYELGFMIYFGFFLWGYPDLMTLVMYFAG